jgi:phosphoketolase
MDAAIAHCTKGAGIWEWVSNEQGAEPDGYIFYATERRFMVRRELTGGSW